MTIAAESTLIADILAKFPPKMLGMYLARAKSAGLFDRHVMRHLAFTAYGYPPGKWAECLTDTLAKIEGRGIVALIGERGNGKTQIACEVVSKACHGVAWGDRPPVLYTRLARVLVDLRSTFEGKGTERDLRERLATAQLLVIDEIHETKTSEFKDLLLADVLDERYGNELPTLLIGNVTPSGLRAALGPSLASRASETGTIVEAKWPGFRTAGETLPTLDALKAKLAEVRE